VASDRISTTRRAVVAAGVVGLAALLVCAFVGWGRPPQMGPDEDVFKTVDALFTAVTSRDERLLGPCEQRLRASREAGKLPAEASDYLDGIIRTARDGQWQAAAERLHGFMKAQRREGAHDPPRKKEKDHPNSGRK
jgi:hypothetical protein